MKNLPKNSTKKEKFILWRDETISDGDFSRLQQTFSNFSTLFQTFPYFLKQLFQTFPLFSSLFHSFPNLFTLFKLMKRWDDFRRRLFSAPADFFKLFQTFSHFSNFFKTTFSDGDFSRLQQVEAQTSAALSKLFWARQDCLNKM